MTEKQNEYLGYITTSTDALLAISNNILDLATIDAGAMKLNLGPVDVRKTIDDAAAGIKDRLAQHSGQVDHGALPPSRVRLRVRGVPGPGRSTGSGSSPEPSE